MRGVPLFAMRPYLRTRSISTLVEVSKGVLPKDLSRRDDSMILILGLKTHDAT